MKKLTTMVLVTAMAVGMFLAGRGCRGDVPAVVTSIDTLVVRDTIRDTVLVPVVQRIVRIDTVFMKAARDTTRVEVEISVERKEYRTDDYRAVVEGFRPTLVEMEIYRPTVYIDRQIRQRAPSSRTRRWGVGIHAGYGLTPVGTAPYIGVGLQYNIIAW